MTRTRYYRKRPGHRAWIVSLWQALCRFMEPCSLEPDIPGLRPAGLSSEQVDELHVILGELGEQFRIGLDVAQRPEEPPDFFAIGAEMPASRFGNPSPRLRQFLKPKGRPRKPFAAPLRPPQAEVDTWMRGRAAFAFEYGEPALKEATVVPECMVAINASRAQARVSFSRLPRELRRQRVQHDRWIAYRAPDPTK